MHVHIPLLPHQQQQQVVGQQFAILEKIEEADEGLEEVERILNVFHRCTCGKCNTEEKRLEFYKTRCNILMARAQLCELLEGLDLEES